MSDKLWPDAYISTDEHREALASQRQQIIDEMVRPLMKALKAVEEDLAIASERWGDSDAGPATKLLEPKDPNDLDVCLEAQEQIRDAFAAVEAKLKEMK